MSSRIRNDPKQIVLIVCVLASFYRHFISSGLTVALPSIALEFKLNTAALGWLQISSLLPFAVFLIPFGRIADIRGRRKVFSAGLLVYLASLVVVPLSTSVEILMASRVMQGLGEALIMSSAAAILTSVFPARERGKILGINIAAVYVGLSLGSLLGGVLIQSYGWRSIFLANIPIGAVALIATVSKVKGEWADAAGSSFDRVGFILYGIALALLTFGASSLSSPLPGGSFLGSELVANPALMILIGCIPMTLFILWEMKFRSPLLDVRLFRHNKIFLLSNMAAFINYSATFAFSFLLTLYLQLVLGLEPWAAGMVLLASHVVQALLSPVAGWVSDRISPEYVSTLGMILNTVSLTIFALFDAKTGGWPIIANLVLMGIGFALFSTPNVSALMGSVSKRDLGVASATLSTMGSLGMIGSTMIVVTILPLFIGTAEISASLGPSLLLGIRESFVSLSALGLIGVMVSLAGANARRKSALVERAHAITE